MLESSTYIIHKNVTEEEKWFSIPTQAAIHLCDPIFGRNRNVTCDNWYSSVELIYYFIRT